MLGRAMESIRQCTRNVVQVIGQALRGRIEQAALRNSGQAISAGDRRDIKEKIAAEVGVQGLRDKVGHAEERLILAWPDNMEDYSHARNGEQPDTAELCNGNRRWTVSQKSDETFRCHWHQDLLQPGRTSEARL
jgi:hypothetical protein